MIADDHSNLRHCGVVLGSHILIRCKTNLSVISTLNNMYRHSNRKIASSSWHRKGLLVIRYWAILSTPVSSRRRHYSQCCEKKLGCRARQWLEVMSANCKFYSDPIYSGLSAHRRGRWVGSRGRYQEELDGKYRGIGITNHVFRRTVMYGDAVGYS